MRGRYTGPNKYIACPDCLLQMEVYPEAFVDREMDHIVCGNTGDVNRQRADDRGCGALFGLKVTLEANIEVYKMKKVPEELAA